MNQTEPISEDKQPSKLSDLPSVAERRVDVGELLFAIRDAYQRMSKRNSHKGLLVTAGALIIHLIEENARLKQEIELWKAPSPNFDLPPITE